MHRLHTQLDRLTHTRQRQRASGRAARRGVPARILVVCYGNICRSPYAAAALHRRLSALGRGEIAVSSAGFYGAGRPANAQAAGTARRRALDLSLHRSRLVDAREAAEADIVLVMTHAQRTQVIKELGVPADRVELLGDFDIEDPPVREILDPYGAPDHVFESVFDQIDNSIKGFCKATAVE